MDLIILNFTIFWFEINLTNAYLFCLYISLSWLLISIKNHFYEVQRHTRIIQIIPLLLRQFSVFAITLYAFIGFFKQPGISRLALVNYLLLVLLLILVFKFLVVKFQSLIIAKHIRRAEVNMVETHIPLLTISWKRMENSIKFLTQTF